MHGHLSGKKSSKKLNIRIQSYEDTIRKLPSDQQKSYRRPGSNKK